MLHLNDPYSCVQVTMGQLMQTFAKVCKKNGMAAMDEGECVCMVQGLESRGILNYSSKGAPRYARVTLRLDEKEVEMALQDKALLSEILDDVASISK